MNCLNRLKHPGPIKINGNFAAKCSGDRISLLIIWCLKLNQGSFSTYPCPLTRARFQSLNMCASKQEDYFLVDCTCKFSRSAHLCHFKNKKKIGKCLLVWTSAAGPLKGISMLAHSSYWLGIWFHIWLQHKWNQFENHIETSIFLLCKQSQMAQSL